MAKRSKRVQAKSSRKTCTATLDVVFPSYLTPNGSCTQPGATPDNPKDHLMFRVCNVSGPCGDAGVFDTVRFVNAEGEVSLSDMRHDFDPDWHGM